MHVPFHFSPFVKRRGRKALGALRAFTIEMAPPSPQKVFLEKF